MILDVGAYWVKGRVSYAACNMRMCERSCINTLLVGVAGPKCTQMALWLSAIWVAAVGGILIYISVPCCISVIPHETRVMV